MKDRFQIIRSGGDRDFIERVNFALSMGWKLHGTMIVTVNGSGEITEYIQAIIISK